MTTFGFAFAGIPGVGKSTLLKKMYKSGKLEAALKQRLDYDFVICYVKEPSKLWREKGWLANFYENPDKRALSFQCLVFDTHVDAVLDKLSKTPPETLVILITERCMWCQLLFWKVQCDLNRASAEPMDDEAYCRMWRKWRLLIPDVDKIFFCQTSNIQHTMRRIATRAHNEELGIFQSSSEGTSTGEEEDIQKAGGLTLEYQTSLMQKHQEWYTQPRAFIPQEGPSAGVPCVHVFLDAHHADEDAFDTLVGEIATHMVASILGK